MECVEEGTCTCAYMYMLCLECSVSWVRVIPEAANFSQEK